MYKVGVVLYEGCYLSSLSGPLDAFQVANAHMRAQQMDNQSMFDWQTISIDKHAVKTSGGITLSPDVSIDQDINYDFIYIPAFFYKGLADFEEMMNRLSPLLDWLVVAWKRKAIIGCNCTGTFILAETGLLNGRKATTTWWLEQTFRTRYPDVLLDSQVMVTEQDNLICAGAMTAFQHMSMYVIEKFVTYDLAMQCAKTMLVNTSENAQSPYHNLMLSESSADPVISKAQFWIQNHLHQNVDQVRLAERAGVSQRTLIRRFKTELGMTPLTYLQNVRIETAKHKLVNTSLSLTQVIYQVGYSDISSFSTLFKKRVGLSPSAYRKRFTQTGH